MTKIFLVRRNFRVDGGAELALRTHAESLRKIAEIGLICQTWLGGNQSLFAEILRIPRSGMTRRGKYASFIRGVEEVAKGKGLILHSHELVPGANVLRMGDGLHSSWIKRANIRDSFISDGFHKFKVRLERECLTHPDLRFVIVNSEFIGDELRETYGFDKPFLIRNIVRDDFVKVLNKKFKIANKLLFVGSGWFRKGLLDGIKALRLMPSLSLHVYGDDKGRSKYIEACARYGVLDRVYFHGVVDVTPAVYDDALALIHPALYEPFPNVATEALSRGVPVVSTSASGSSDFSQHEGVWTLQESSDICIRDAISDIASLSLARRRSFREHIMRFDQKYLSEKLHDLYSNILE